MIQKTLLACILSSAAYAYPADATVDHSSPHLLKRNPCDGKDAEPVLYHDYKNDVCPPPFTFESPGNCHMKRFKEPGWNIFKPPHCGGFCEENVKFKYGRESIFLASPYCHGPMTCGITDTQTTAWAFNLNIPISNKFTDDFTAGISGGITYTSTTARAISKSVTLKQNECGYFTWIPILKESCGTYTGDGKYVDVAPGHPEGLCKDGTSHPDTCILLPNAVRGTDKDPWGITVLVRVDCETHAPLPAECISPLSLPFSVYTLKAARETGDSIPPFKYPANITFLIVQDAAYNNEGVPLDRGIYNAYTDTFEEKDKMYGQTSEIDCSLDDPSKAPLLEDCSAALATGMLVPMIGLLQGAKGGQWWASYVHSCAFQIEYEQDWTEDCIVGKVEVLRAAAGIMNTCKVQDGRIGGKRTIRNDGKCNATLRLANTEGRDLPQDMSPLVGKK